MLDDTRHSCAYTDRRRCTGDTQAPLDTGADQERHTGTRRHHGLPLALTEHTGTSGHTWTLRAIPRATHWVSPIETNE